MCPDLNVSNIVGIYGLQSPRIPREHNNYHGHTVRDTPNCPLKVLVNSSNQGGCAKDLLNGLVE